MIFATISLHNMAGGLERNIIRISNYLAARGHSVSILSFDLPDAVSFYPIDEKVKWHKVGQTAPHQPISFTERLKLLCCIRGVFKSTKASTLIVFHHGLLPRLMLAKIGLGIKTICSERSALTIYNHIVASKWNISFFLMFFASKILVQFESYKKDYPLLMRQKMWTVPNVVEPAKGRAQPSVADDKGRFEILAVGRLCDQKNYASLIEAFAMVSEKYADWDLTIIGSGALKDRLTRQIKASGLERRISIQDAQSDIYSRYAKSHIYTMPSKWEGFPNALAEALSCGLPAVGFKNCAGVADLISHGNNGLLADGNGDALSLAAQLEVLMNDPSRRDEMGEGAINSVATYTEERIYPEWERLL